MSGSDGIFLTPEEEKLIWAATRGRTEDVIELLKQVVNVDTTDEYGQTALMWALSGGNIECVKVLLNRGALANQQNKDGQTMLMWMSLQGSVECVETLLDHGAQINQEDKEGQTPLMGASYGGSVECVQMLLDRGAQVNVQDKNGHTPLMRASLGGKAECIKVLLDHGAQINQQDKDGLTPLMRASYRGNIDCVKVLLERGALVNQQDKERTPLMEASLGAKVECVQLLLDGGAQVDEQNKGGRTSLMEALSGGSIECVKLLLDRGAKINQQDKHGQTALMMMSLAGNVECVQLLLDMGAEVNQQDESGLTPLLRALSGGSVECVKLLLNRGAQANQEDKHGRTPLMEASNNGVVECVQMLLERGAQVNQQSKEGDTALHRATRERHLACAKVLLIHPGTDPNIRNNEGLTCVDIMSHSCEDFNMLRKMVEKYNSFPVASYGKVVLCGNPGAGKSTLCQAIIKCSKPMTAATRLAKQAFGWHGVVEHISAGTIPHQVDSPYGNMIVYDLAEHHHYFSLESPATFLLLQDITKDNDVITKELHYWSTVINDIGQNFPCQSSVIVVGTHADLLTVEQQTIKLAHLQSVARLAINHQILVEVLALNLKKTYGRKMGQLMDLLHQTNDAVVKECPPISLLCHVLYASLNETLPGPDADGIIMSDLIAHLAADQDKLIVPSISQVLPLLKCLSEKGLIFFISSSNPDTSLIVFHLENILRKIYRSLFLHPSLKEYLQIATTTGIVPKAVLSEWISEYNAERIAQLLIQFGLCQIVNLSLVDTNTTQEGLDPLLFFPALIKAAKLTNTIVSNKSFGWSMIVKSPFQFFPMRLLHNAIHRLALELSLPSLHTTPLYLHLSHCCEVWPMGIRWHGETDMTVIVEMSDSFQSLSLAVSCNDRTDSKYSALVHTALSVVKKAYQEFCPHIEVLELISYPSVASADHTISNVELLLLKKALLQQEMYIVDVNDEKHALRDWLEIEPCLPYLVEVSTSMIDPEHTTLQERVTPTEDKSSRSNLH